MDVFEVMAEPVRRRIIEILASGEHTAGQLADAVTHEFRITRTAVSKHLRHLREAGFVEVRPDERFRWYYFTADGLEQLEMAVDDLRERMKGGVGKDPFACGKRDPMYPMPYPYRVPFKGPGRPTRRGTRGAQTAGYIATEPDDGLFFTGWPQPLPSSYEPAEYGAPPRIDG